MNLKTFYWAISAQQRWGKGATPEEARKNAALKTNSKIEHFINTLILSGKTTNEEFEKLKTFWAVNNFGSVEKCYDITEQDQELINLRFVGWSSIHYNNPNKT